MERKAAAAAALWDQLYMQNWNLLNGAKNKNVARPAVEVSYKQSHGSPLLPSLLRRHNWFTDTIYHLNYAPIPSLPSSTAKPGSAALLFSCRLPSGINSSLITDITAAHCFPFPLTGPDASKSSLFRGEETVSAPISYHNAILTNRNKVQELRGQIYRHISECRTNLETSSGSLLHVLQTRDV